MHRHSSLNFQHHHWWIMPWIIIFPESPPAQQESSTVWGGRAEFLIERLKMYIATSRLPRRCIKMVYSSRILWQMDWSAAIKQHRSLKINKFVFPFNSFVTFFRLSPHTVSCCMKNGTESEHSWARMEWVGRQKGKRNVVQISDEFSMRRFLARSENWADSYMGMFDNEITSRLVDDSSKAER